MKIIINNNKSRLVGERSIIHKLREDTKIKHPQAFWSHARRMGKWDGFIRCITEETNMFATGLLPEILERLSKMNVEVSFTDQRMNPEFKQATKLGGLRSREYQFESCNRLLNNEVYGIPFPRGILYEATNAGKNLIAALVFKSYPNLKGIFLINNTEIFVQALEEFEILLPGKIGQISSKKIDIKQYTICMVQTLRNRIKDPKIKNIISQIPIVIGDEADELINRKDCREIFSVLYNAPIRVALTGTAFRGKDTVKHLYLKSFFGPIIHATTNKQMVDMGFSANPIIRFYFGRQRRKYSDYNREYDRNIIKNKKRNLRIWEIIKNQHERNRGPSVIIIRYLRHIKELLKCKPDDLSIKYIHGEVPMFRRKRLIEDFRNNKIDVMIVSMILKRGKNIKSMNTLINAAGGDSEETIVQILGRGLRLNETMNNIYVYDFFDYGKYIMKHSKHRIKYYTQEKFEVKELYHKLLKKVQKNTI